MRDKYLAALLVAVNFAASAGPVLAGATDDPYAPLKLYEGKWKSTTTIGDKEIAQFENHCSRTGTFFVCEQTLAGKPGSLVIFLPGAKTADAGQEYTTTWLTGDTISGAWNKLTIAGERWVYSWQDSDGGKKTFWRNVNQFSGADKIHFEIQRSDDSVTWKTVKGGDEIRLPMP